MEHEFDTLIITYPPNIPPSYTALESLVRESLPTDRQFVLLAPCPAWQQALRRYRNPDVKSPARWLGSGYFLLSIILSARALALSINRFCLSS